MELFDVVSHLGKSLLLMIIAPFYKLSMSADERFFYIYLIVGLLLVFFFRSKMVLKDGVWGTLTDKKVWTSRSAINDYFILFINSFIVIALVSFGATHIMELSQWVVQFFRSLGVTGEVADSSAYLAGLALTVTLFVAKDFVFFILHYLAHVNPVIWEFHKVHHSAEVMNFTTSERSHPVELMMFTLGISLTVALVNGLFFSFFGDSLTVATVMGANILVFFQNMIGGALRHSPFPLPYPKAVEKWLVSPAMHHIHHSANAKHFDKNMGKTIALWDRIYGTHYHSEDNMKLQYGLGGTEHKAYRTLSQIYISPFVKAKVLLLGETDKNDVIISGTALKAGEISEPKVGVVKEIAISSLYIGLIAGMVYIGMSLPGISARSEKMQPNVQNSQPKDLPAALKKAVKLGFSKKKPSVFLEELTFAEVQYLIHKGSDSVIIPTGGTEQNGLHMVLGKHNFVVKYTAQQIAKKAGNILVAPVMAYVPEGDIKSGAGHMAFAGTLSLPEDVFEKVLENTALSLKKHGFKTIYLLGDSGGNQAAQSHVAKRLNKVWMQQGVRIIHLGDYYTKNKQDEALRSLGEDKSTIGSHAGMRDSSELLFIKSDGIRTDILAELKSFSSDWNMSGYTGRPDKATSELGRKMIALKVRAALDQIAHSSIKGS